MTHSKIPPRYPPLQSFGRKRPAAEASSHGMSTTQAEARKDVSVTSKGVRGAMGPTVSYTCSNAKMNCAVSSSGGCCSPGPRSDGDPGMAVPPHRPQHGTDQGVDHPWEDVVNLSQH